MIQHVHQPTALSCGHACAAMVTGLPVERLIRAAGDGPTCSASIDRMLRAGGWHLAQLRLRRVSATRPLPEFAVLRVVWPDEVLARDARAIPRDLGHWVLWAEDRAWDPMDPGVRRLDHLDPGRVTSYLEVLRGVAPISDAAGARGGLSAIRRSDYLAPVGTARRAWNDQNCRLHLAKRAAAARRAEVVAADPMAAWQGLSTHYRGLLLAWAEGRQAHPSRLGALEAAIRVACHAFAARHPDELRVALAGVGVGPGGAE